MKIKPKATGLYLLLAGFYCLLLALFAAIAISMDMRREKERFAETANFIHSHLETLANRNLIALHGFAALLQVEEPEERDEISAYVRFVLANHPYVHMMEIVRKVSKEDLDSLIAEQQKAGFPEFQLKTFAFEGSREWGPVDDKPTYYLLTFMEPLLPESRDLLGVDFASAPVLREALEKSLKTQGPVASRPFRLIEGEKGYMLIRPVQRAGKEMFALVICKASSLLPAQMPDQDSLSVEIYHAGRGADREEAWLIRREAEVQSGVFSGLFPKLSFTRPVGGPEQPFTLKIERQLDWRIVNRDMLAAILIGGMMLLPLLMAYARAHHRNEMRRLDEGNKLFYRANFDGLTGLPNRQLFLNRLEQALAVAHRQSQRHAVLYLDLDGFKHINDYYGHAIGDRVLQRAARIFLHCVREMDTVARLGGDEFVVLLQDVASEASAESVARKIKKAFLQPSSENSKSLPMIGVSIGLAIYPDDGESATDLLIAADQAMYQEKAPNKAKEPAPLTPMADRALNEQAMLKAPTP